MGVSWADEGKYLTSAVVGIRDIRNENDVMEYARTLWKKIGTTDIDGDYTAYQLEDGTWFVTMSADGQDMFSAYFLNNGAICDIAQTQNDDRWWTDGKYVESKVMDPQELADLEEWATEQLDTLVPGLTNELQEYRLSYVRDVGDAKYVSLQADPKDSSYDAGVSHFIRVNADHSYILLNLQLSGNG